MALEMDAELRLIFLTEYILVFSFAVLGFVCFCYFTSGFDMFVLKLMYSLLQQHGSVFWRKGARHALHHLDPRRRLHELLQVTTTAALSFTSRQSSAFLVTVQGQASSVNS